MPSLTKLVNFSYDEAKLIKRQFGEFFRFVVIGFPDSQPQPITSIELTCNQRVNG